MLARGLKVDVVGAGGGHQDQLEVRALLEHLGSDANLVADRHLCALQPLGHLLSLAAPVQDQFAERCAQRREVEVTEVEGGMVEEDGASRIHER